jgi:biopolymer transport protein ExbB/TolQ
MKKRVLSSIKSNIIILSIVLILGAGIGSVVTYFIEEKKVEFWKERFVEANELNQSLKKEKERFDKEKEELIEENKALRKDLAVTILSSVRSNYYNLKALKSENYNKQMYFNEMEYRTNLVPRAIGKKWDLNILQSQYNRELQHIIDSLQQNKK